MNARFLREAVTLNARELIFSAPTGDRPLMVIGGEVVLPPGIYTVRQDGSFQLMRPPFHQVRVII